MSDPLAMHVRRALVGVFLAVLCGSPAWAQQQSDEKPAQEKPSTAESSESSPDPEGTQARPAETSKAATSDDPSVRRIRTTAPTVVRGTSSQKVSPLVQAARSSSETKERRTYTNADLANAKGSMIIVEGTNVREPEIIPIEQRAPEAVRPAGQDANAAAAQYQRKLEMERLTQQISQLEKDLGHLENSYLLEEQEDVREATEAQYVEKQKALDAARKRLQELRAGGGE